MTGRRGGRWRALVAVGASVALPGCWLQSGFDASQTRWNPVEHEITTENVAGLAEVWSVDVEAFGLFEPLVYGGRVFVGRQASIGRQAAGYMSGGVLALDAATGATRWDRTTTPAGEYVTTYPPAIVEGEVWSSWWNGDPDGCEFATVRLDRDGTVAGTDRSAFPWSSAAQSGRYVVQALGPRCPTASDWPPARLTVRDSRTLDTLWTADAGMGTVSGGQILTSPFFPLAGCGAPTCTSDVRPERMSTLEEPYVARPGSDVFGVKGSFGAVNAEIFALSRTTGGLVWGASIRSLDATLAADDEHLYVATSSGGPWGGRLLTYDIDGCGRPSCEPLWAAPVDPGGSSAWAPTVAGGVVYVAGDDNAVHAFPAGGCGRSLCDEIGRVTVDGRIGTMSVAEGRLVVTSEVTPGRMYRVTAFAP